jgi:hypothetical protein
MSERPSTRRVRSSRRRAIAWALFLLACWGFAFLQPWYERRWESAQRRYTQALTAEANQQSAFTSELRQVLFQNIDEPPAALEAALGLPKGHLHVAELGGDVVTVDGGATRLAWASDYSALAPVTDLHRGAGVVADLSGWRLTLVFRDGALRNSASRATASCGRSAGSAG